MEISDVHETFIVTEKVYQGFINCFQDENPLHVNADFAKSKGFQDKVMHGNILNGFLSFVIGEKLPKKNVIIHKQTIKFSNPFFLNDQLDCDLILDKFVESVMTYIFKFSFKRGDVVIASGTIQIGEI